MATLVIDTGMDIVGILDIETGAYRPYRGRDIPLAIQIIKTADEVVTYNGKDFDLRELGKFAGLEGDMPLSGKHTDMRSICWSDRIWGSNLTATYSIHFASCPDFPDTYEGSNERDVHMTYKLWELWKQSRLRIIDGNIVYPTPSIS